MLLRNSIALCAITIVLGASFGCESDQTAKPFTETLFNPFNLNPLFDVKQEPLRIGLVAERVNAWDVRAWWDITDRTPWIDLRTRMGQAVGRPIQISYLKLFQLSAQLKSGRLDFALLTSDEFTEIENQVHDCRTIAIAKNRDETGLIVASAKSSIQSIPDIEGNRFAFGPRGDAIFHYGAAAALTDAGVTPDKITRELIPLNTLQYHLSAKEAAKEIVYGTTPAGVISKSEYDKYADTGGRLFPVVLSKDQFRVLGETPRIEYGPVIASPHADPEMVKKVQEFLLTVGERYPDATRSMLTEGFTGVPTANMP